MKTTQRKSAIADAVAFSEEAHASAVQSREFGAAHDFLVMGHILTDDVALHTKLSTSLSSHAQRLHAILADGKVSASEVQELAAIERGLGNLSGLSAT